MINTNSKENKRKGKETKKEYINSIIPFNFEAQLRISLNCNQATEKFQMKRGPKLSKQQMKKVTGSNIQLLTTTYNKNT